MKRNSADNFDGSLILNENNFDKESPVSTEIEEHTEEIQFNDLVTTTQNKTSQDRISYHTKRKAPFPPPHPPRLSLPHYHHHHHHRPHHHPHHHYHHHHHPHHYRIPHQSKSRKKYRRGYKKPTPISISKPNHMKVSYKPPTKPILLSDVIRIGGQVSYNMLKPNGLYIEEDELEINPFSSGDPIDSFPSPLNKFSRPPPSIEMVEDMHDSFPSIAPVEEEIIFPSGANLKPYSVIRRPTQTNPIIWSPTKLLDTYIDDDSQDNIRNMRLPKPQNSNIDKDIINFLTKMKQEGLNLDSKPSPSEQISTITRDNNRDINTAISKVLLPFLSESTVKQIQSYFNRLPSDKQHSEEKNVTKVVYIIENQSREFNKNSSNEVPYGTYSVTEPLREPKTNNTTYFIMVKSPNQKNFNVSSSTGTNAPKIFLPEHEKIHNTTPPSLRNLALQNYIMSLAGVNKPQNNYLPPRVKSYQTSLQESGTQK